MRVVDRWKPSSPSFVNHSFSTMRIIPETCLGDQKNRCQQNFLRIFLTLGLLDILSHNVNFRKEYGDSVLFATTKERNVPKVITNSNNSIRATCNYGYETRATTNFSWIGNRWYPPQGVPEFPVHQIRDLFRGKNRLKTRLLDRITIPCTAQSILLTPTMSPLRK